MYRTWLFNLVVSMITLVVYFVIALFNKPLVRAVLESIIAASLIYIAAYLFRWLLVYINKDFTVEPLSGENVDSNTQETRGEDESQQPIPPLQENQVEQLSTHIKHLLEDE
ncbi:hypothetical protein LS684_08360 [Cytobacillus spongiae]|uniref:hypothetical protein n=1 Tax=Cytobacillus spongiae TaxID=2901381 RepID=UPI001F200D43|nr:hypothetical protein [Cytobacillus spongiae]UII57434.1 hypothetical protein LS684_08360 [Cytobacillus spongiae]